MIQVLDKLTIDQIAAGEVVERPLSIVKELVENAIDAGADAITVEIRGGGIDQIRVTDNGSGIPADQVKTAFLRHATSKIVNASDLLSITSLGFRGEALSSIAAVSKVELITRTHESIVGCRYLINGGEEAGLEEIGSPEGTTFIVRDVFYNTPARREFLKSATTETNAISECVLQFSLSYPDIRFQYIADGKPKLKTSGDGVLRNNIFYNFGSDMVRVLLPVTAEEGVCKLAGYIAKPEFSRGNRTYMHYYVNGRYVKNNTIHAAIMDGYRDYLMSHRFPFVTLFLTLPPDQLDVNIHPTKKEVRFRDEKTVYELFYHTIKDALDKITLIPEETLSGDDDTPAVAAPIKKDPEPFEKNRSQNEYVQSTMTNFSARTTIDNNANQSIQNMTHDSTSSDEEPNQSHAGSQSTAVTSASTTTFGVAEASRFEADLSSSEQKRSDAVSDSTINNRTESVSGEENRAGSFLEENLFREEESDSFRVIGQVFDTYWLIEYKNELLIIDQHAAHEKVLYERFVAKMKAKTMHSQKLLAPIVITLSGREQTVLSENADAFRELGFEWENFGDAEYLLRGVPADFLNLDVKEVFIDILDSLMDGQRGKKPEMILDRLATISCKAAVKGNNTLSLPEIKTLIREMLTLDEPYHCPHGRPTTIALSKYEFEKRFKR
ncbi:MAG: DNA mismatch repair endonuclease MutL [Eubacterium sp.]|nr:DNA mismatch repair endonuclease MutL [Eubacterium sp.]